MKKSNKTNLWLAAIRTQGLGMMVVVWNKGAEAVKGKMKSFYGVRIVQCLDCGDGYNNPIRCQNYTELKAQKHTKKLESPQKMDWNNP